MVEISATDGNGDGNSVAASSVSVDDFAFSSTGNRGEYPSPKKPSWTERHDKTQVSPTARRANGCQNSTNDMSRSAAQASADIEKIVEQRVQARVAVVEMRMEEQMQRLEKRMEGRMKTRIDVIDEKIDKTNSMLAMLLSRELSGHENWENEI
jgi:LPS O-antigen subunit length determinant protein (WzzB/FepE family)